MNNILVPCSLACTLGLFLGQATDARAQWSDQGPVLAITEENDTVLHTDRYYSQGLKLSYLNSDNRLFGWTKKLSDGLPALGFSVNATRIGMEVGQDLFTPANIHTNFLMSNERPYAGVLYTGFILQRRGTTSGGHPVLENFQIDLGIIGPDSLADRSQSWAHSNDQGTLDNWRNQVKDEPGIALKYERSMLISPGAKDGHRFFDFIPHAGFSLGNIETSLRAGAMVRLGLHLPDDFGPQRIHSLTTIEGGRPLDGRGGHYGFYIFAGADGWAVAHDASLDGNLWQNSAHVTKEPLVGEFTGGVALVFPIFELICSGDYRTHEFTQQNNRAGYGTLTLKFNL